MFRYPQCIAKKAQILCGTALVPWRPQRIVSYRYPPLYRGTVTTYLRSSIWRYYEYLCTECATPAMGKGNHPWSVSRYKPGIRTFEVDALFVDLGNRSC